MCEVARSLRVNGRTDVKDPPVLGIGQLQHESRLETAQDRSDELGCSFVQERTCWGGQVKMEDAITRVDTLLSEVRLCALGALNCLLPSV